jgi:dihydropyrimidinase
VSEPDLVVRGGDVVNADSVVRADVCVSRGRVSALTEPGAAPPAEHEVDATGRLVLPGGVDPHCHVGFTSGEFTTLDDYPAATRAAVHGGTTTIVDFGIPVPGERVVDAVHRQREQAPRGYCDSGLHACVVDWDETTGGQLDQLASEGVVTVKMFTTYRDETMADEETILRTMKHLRTLGGMVYIHCESNTIVEDTQDVVASGGDISAHRHHETRPELSESAAVAAVLALAEHADAPVYFVHQSTPEAVALVERARREGRRAYGEAVVHHLTLDQGEYASDHPERFVCCPPLRSAHTVQGLRHKLMTGALSTIGSDHCCYDTGQKVAAMHDVRAMPNGLPGVETRLPVTFSEFVSSGLMPVTRFVDLTSTSPARLNGLYPRKGLIAPGSDADLVLWDPRATATLRATDLHMATDYTPYEGRQIRGLPVTVLVRGRIVVRDREFVATRPRGQFVAATPIHATV